MKEISYTTVHEMAKHEYSYEEDDNRLSIKITEPLSEEEADKLIKYRLTRRPEYRKLRIEEPQTLLRPLHDFFSTPQQYSSVTLKGEIGSTNMQLLASLLRNPSVTEFELVGAKITDEDLSFILDALRERNTPISLNLNSNAITDTGINYVDKFIREYPMTLSGINVMNNYLTNKSYQTLGALLHTNTGLTTLFLGCNNEAYETKCEPLTSEVIKVIFNGLKSNTTLLQLGLGNYTDDIFKDTYFRGKDWSTNHTLTHLTLYPMTWEGLDASFKLLECFSHIGSLTTVNLYLNIALSSSRAKSDPITALKQLTKNLRLSTQNHYYDFGIYLGKKKIIELCYFVKEMQKIKNFYQLRVSYQEEEDRIFPYNLIQVISDRNKKLKMKYDRLLTLMNDVNLMLAKPTTNFEAILSISSLLGEALALVEELDKENLPKFTTVKDQYYTEHAKFLFQFDECFKAGLEKLQLSSNLFEKMNCLLNLTNSAYLENRPRERMLLALAQCRIPLGQYLKKVEQIDSTKADCLNLTNHLIYELIGGSAVTAKTLTWQEMEKENPDLFKKIIDEVEAIQIKTVDEVVNWLEVQNQSQPFHGVSQQSLESNAASTNVSIGHWMAQKGLVGTKRPHDSSVNEAQLPTQLSAIMPYNNAP